MSEQVFEQHPGDGAPPKPGDASPVPADAAARAAAAGRLPRARRRESVARDALVPATAVETRAEARAARRARWAAMQAAAPPVVNPGAGMPPVPGGWMRMPTAPGFIPPGPLTYGPSMPGPAMYGPPMPGPAMYGPPMPGPAMYGPPMPGPAMYGPPMPGPAMPGQPVPGPVMYGPPLGYAQPYAFPAPLPPRIVWNKAQRRAVFLGGLLGQTVMSAAVHFAGALLFVTGIAALAHWSGEGSETDFESDGLTDFIADWSTPDRIGWLLLLGALVAGGLLALGYIAQALWQRSAGVAHPHRSTWLAWLCTTFSTGALGTALWPPVGGGTLFFVLASPNASFSVGSLWATLFALLAVATVLCGVVGMLFTWLFCSASRPRVDFAALAAAEEAAARARDIAELTADRWS